MSGHTPGPWRVLSGTYNKGCVVGADGTVVSDDPNTTLDDAIVMAAAPELLEALKSVMDGIDDFWLLNHAHEVESAKSAIAKAEGR